MVTIWQGLKWVNSMTDVNETEAKQPEGLKKRLHRRSLLKAGAVAAPIAMTLHGGIPLAHADSAGLCVVQLIEIAKGNDSRAEMLQVPMKGGRVAIPHNRSHKPLIKPQDLATDYPEGTTLQPFNASPEHWKFLSDPNNNRFGFSCVSSIGFNNFAKSSSRV